MSGNGGRGTDSRRRLTLLGPVAALVTRHPRLVVGVWIVVMAVLGIIGSGLEGKVSTRPVYVNGSPSQREHEIAVREFGGEDSLVVLLSGPPAAVDRQGRELVAHLKGIPETLTISPWSSSGSLKGLRPSPRAAAVLVSVGKATEESNSEAVPIVERTIADTVKAPVRVSVAGGPAVIHSLIHSITQAANFGERLAIPVLMIVLLIVCRSLLAAALPVVIGGLVVGATRGILDILAGSMVIDSFALGTAGMLGLALGVDYSLLIVSRFREEMEAGGDVETAVRTTVQSTGRQIIPAGCGLILAMLVSMEILPGSFVTSVALAVIAASVLSVLSAMFLAPAALTLLGSRLDRWSLPRRRPSGSAALAWSRQLSRRPGVVLGLVFALMLCGAWAFTLNTDTGSAKELPPNDPGRMQQEQIERKLGPGWVAPFEIVMTGGDRPVTTPHRLQALTDFQHRVERDPGVEAMAGFASLEKTTEQLGSVEGSLAAQRRGTVKLGHGLARVQKGSAATTGGFTQGSEGADQLGSAVGQARAGSGQLASGLRSSVNGSKRLSGGLERSSEGSGKLTDATGKASTGAGKLATKVAQARKQTAEALSATRPLKNALRSGERSLHAAPLRGTEEQLATAWRALQQMTSGRGDPQYAAALVAVEAANRNLTGTDLGSEEEGEASTGVVVGVRRALNQFNLGLYLAARQDKNGRQARDGMDKLAKASDRLDRGLRKLTDHSQELSQGIARLSHGGAQLPPGLRRLTVGAEQLVGGLGKVESGAGSLAGGLAGGAQKSHLLTGALGRLRSGAEKGAGSSGLNEQSPGLFRSGYFYLAGLDGSRPQQRAGAGLLVNLAKGGSAARMLVVPGSAPASAGASRTGARLTADAAELARETGSEVFVGGLPPQLTELNDSLRAQAPLARLVLSLVTFLVLLPVTRSLTLPILAALLNLLTVSATFGMLSLLFNDSLLGGPGFVDTAVIPASVILTFGLAIDYEVFIFARMREEYVRTGSNRTAIDNGLAQTAQVVSGAAVIMISVFLAFSVSPLANVRNFGLAQAIGVFIDAFLIRFVILPAAMRALGDRSWWIPKWLDRILPGGVPARASTGG